MLDRLPADVLATIREFLTAEFTTMAKDGTPITWAVAAQYLADEGGGPGRFQLTTSIAFPQKAFNVRRNPHVSLLFSDPTGCRLKNSPAVLVQGLGSSPKEVVTGLDTTRDYWRDAVYRKQNSAFTIVKSPLWRRTMDWYFMRLVVYVSPLVVYWWPERDFSRPPQKLEVQSHVG